MAAVLFDIDETLVDLRAANSATVRVASAPLLGAVSKEDLELLSKHFIADSTARYDAYLRGELSFAGQRIARAKLAFEHIGRELADADSDPWNSSFEEHAKTFWEPFADAVPLLDALDACGVPYGAVSNNYTSYQRTKLDVCGLQRIQVLVGTDTVGVPKPDPRIFHEGARLLGADPEAVLYVGDNVVADALGARDAGLQSVLLTRPGTESAADVTRATDTPGFVPGLEHVTGVKHVPGIECVPGAVWSGPVISSLSEVTDYLG